LDRKIRIINVDKIDYSSNKFCNNKFLKYPNYSFYKDNIGNEKSLLKILYKHKPKYIVNFAAETHVDNSIIRPEKFIINNTLEYTSLLEVVRIFINKNKNSIRIFLNISTDEVYGSLNKKEKTFKETNKFYPNNPYSASKASCDLISRAWNKTFKIPIITTNCSNNFGPFQNKEKLIPKIILSALRGKKIPIYGKGTNIRDWIYVEDHCSGIEKTIDLGKPGQIYNFGGGNEITNFELAEIILGYFQFGLDKIEYVQDRKGHDYRYSVSFEKSSTELNWKPIKNFKDGLFQTIEWYKNNTEWWENLKH
jgi:dTDP-glucose 4,6-dehydratase